MEGTNLKVKEASVNEVGRGMARVDPEVFKRLGLTSGDVLLIEGKRKSAAIAWQGREDDSGSNIIRMDGILRHNSGVGIDETVKVNKTGCQNAREIIFAPQQQIDFGRDFPVFVKEKILNMPLMQGNSIVIDVMGSHLALIVANVKPRGIVRITPSTSVNISKKPVKSGGMAPGIRYEDIGGLKEETDAVREMIETPIRHPEVFKKLGVKPPKGVLLYGPPGTGKTLLARAVANETDAHFIPLNGPEIMSKYYGQSEENLREIFTKAQENAPAIIFIDEIDAIAPARGEVSGEVEKRVVSQLLTLMDGLKARGEIVVIAATNRPEAVDPALRRPGRFDREVEIGVPNETGRKEVLQIHTRGMPLTEDIDLDKFAAITYGYTGADLESLTKEAAMKALKRVMPDIKQACGAELSSDVIDRIRVTKDDFHQAMTKVEPSAMREVNVQIPDIRWSDIGGHEKVKRQLRESIEWPIRYPDLFKETGVNPPKGVLLYGPAGCGKTLLAKAAARESGVNFISIKGPELLNKYVGESERGIRKVFNRARQVSPSIIFFDELDSLVPKRGSDFGNDVGEKVVAQLLSEIDGVSSLKDVMVMGSTNRPDLIDDALMRPGRLDKIVYVPYPDEDSRAQILKIHMKDMMLEQEIDEKRLVRLTEGYTGADIAAVCREAGMNSIREAIDKNMKKPKAAPVLMRHFEEAAKQVKASYGEKDRDHWNCIREDVGERG